MVTIPSPPALDAFSHIELMHEKKPASLHCTAFHLSVRTRRTNRHTRLKTQSQSPLAKGSCQLSLVTM